MQKLDITTLENNPNYDDTQFITELESKVSSILSREFPDVKQKQQVRKDVNGLVIACPYCRDSMKSLSKKRGHILIRGNFAGYYKCFNCGTFVPITKFMTDYDETLTLSGIKYIQEHKTQNMQISNNSSTEITADVFCKELALKYGIERNAFRDYLNLYEVSNDCRAKYGYNYLVGRLQFKFENFLYDPKLNCIVILNLCENKVIGCQLRLLNKNVPKEKRYLTYNLDKIYKNILKRPDIQIPEELNTISSLFGIYQVNVYKPIIVTEGPLDAFLLPNAIATAGANKRLSIELPFWYLFDSDDTGLKHAIEKLKEHHKVFLWGKLKEDLGINKTKYNKIVKWDVNDVIIYAREKYGYEYKIDWYKYFSDNTLDIFLFDDLKMKL